MRKRERPVDVGQIQLKRFFRGTACAHPHPSLADQLKPRAVDPPGVRAREFSDEPWVGPDALWRASLKSPCWPGEKPPKPR